MPQLRTTNEFSAAITSDLTWRVREISDLRAVARQVDSSLQLSVLRASIPLLYAHWEGHVNYVAKSYFAFLALRKPQYSMLKSNFLLNEFFSKIHKMRQTSSSHEQIFGFLLEVLRSGDRQFRAVDGDLVSAKSNLRSDVLQDICIATGVSYEEFKADSDFIDKILADRRNSIAHGEFLRLTYDDFVEISDRALGLMRKFNNLIDNDVTLGRYRAEKKRYP